MTLKPAVLFWVVSCLATAPAQDRLQTIVDLQVTNLANRHQRSDALQRLENMAALLVPELRKRLHWQRRDELNQQQQLDLLYVLGKAGKPGAAALPELQEWLRGDSHKVRDQLIRTFGELAPFLSAEQAKGLHDELKGVRLRYGNELSTLFQLLRMVPQPKTDELLSFLSRENYQQCAACRWLIAQGPACMQLTDEFRDEAADRIETQLDRLLKRRFVAFWRGTRETAGELAETWLLLTGKPVDSRIARGLLQHRQPDQRRRALVFLRDEAALPVEQRLEVVVRLWDGSATVANAAADTVRAWGVEGVVGIPGLLALLEQRKTSRERDPIEAALRSITEACDALADEDATWLRVMIAALRGDRTNPPTVPPSNQGRRLLAELLRMAQWHDAERLDRALQLLHGANPDQRIVGSVYSWVDKNKPATTELALSWLAHYPELTARSIGNRADLDVENELTLLAMFWVQQVRPTAIEAGAWILTANRTPAALRKQLDSVNPRLQVRAVAELLLQPATHIEPALTTLRQLAYQRLHVPLKLPTTDHDYVTDGNLSEPLRLLAAIGVALAGQQLEDKHALAEVVEKNLGIELRELPTFVALARRADTLGDVIERCERMCREKLIVPPYLAWPRAGKR